MLWPYRMAAALHPDALIQPPASVPLHHGVALATKGLTVRYGTVVALQDVDLVVPEGAVVGLIGPNGAGKSTLMKALSGLIRPIQGAIGFDGAELERLPAHLVATLREIERRTRIPPTDCLRRLAEGKVRELIMGTNPTVDGDGTALYIQNVVQQRFPGVQITRLARGLPAGSSIEYANRNILSDAISGRQKM